MTSSVQESFENFKHLKSDPFQSKGVLLDDLNNPDKKVYNSIQAIDTQNYFLSERLSLFEKFRINSENFSMKHFNIRSAKKNLKNSRTFFLKQTQTALLKVLCSTETRFDDRNSESSLYQQPQYTTIHQYRSPSHKSGRGGDISMCIHDSLNFKFRKDLYINTKNVESI